MGCPEPEDCIARREGAGVCSLIWPICCMRVSGAKFLLFLLLCGAVRGCTGWHGRCIVIGESPGQGHIPVRVGTG